MSEQSLESIFADYQPFLEKIETQLKNCVSNWTPQVSAVQGLVESMAYSLLSGGKRFRPLLSLLTVDALEGDIENVIPWAVAVEMIHTYSLIHDDLPCMDDDDVRRGRPTNHKVYGEALALLAGDALLTEAFAVLAESYRQQPGIALELVSLLSHAAGLRGMIGGQVMDINEAFLQDIHPEQITNIHELKTGALIKVAIEGAAVVCGTPTPVRAQLAEYGRLLGLAFQVADDILDYDPEHPELCSLTASMGMEKTKAYLDKLSQQAVDCLASLPRDRGKALLKMVDFNKGRKV